MLRNKIISIVALATIGMASPTGYSLAVEAAGTEVADSTGEEAVFTQAAAAFTVADLAFAEADFAVAGSALSDHTPTVIIPTIMVVTTREAAIWSLGGS
jgi:hypothetical protein